MNEFKLKIKTLAIIFFCCYTVASCFSTTVQAENDTATTTNILPNAGTTSSSRDAFDLDGVKTGSNVDLTNNGTHNGFTITCNTQVGNACGRALSGELEASHDMKVSASDTLIGIDGTEAGTTYTTTQKKLDGGIQLNSYFSIQNCEDGNSNHSCGYSSGADDSYNLHIKIKDADGNTLAQMTTTRLDDAGYNSNSAKFHDNLVWNGTGGASYEWYWEGIDGSESSSALRGPNLLGAELLLDFPIDDHEPLTLQERTVINEALNTTELTENEIYDIISGLESMIEEEFFASGNLEEGARLELSIEETGLTFEVASKETGAIIMEAPMAQEKFSSVMEAMPIETLKEEMVAMVQEEMPFMTMMEELTPPSKMEPPVEKMKEEVGAKTNTPKETLPVVSKKETLSPTKKEEPKVTKAPPGMTPAKKEKQVVKKESTHEKKKEEPKEKKSISKTTSKSTTKTASNQKQEGVQSEEAQVTKLELVMKKIDTKIKNPVKNLQLKNIIKMDAMTNDQVSLLAYNNIEFYKPKDIYLNQLNIFDSRDIYNNVNLSSYTNNDTIAIKANKLYEIKLKKQKLLMELKELKNG
jgi:outer membrane biosynthesis protein TonB